MAIAIERASFRSDFTGMILPGHEAGEGRSKWRQASFAEPLVQPREDATDLEAGALDGEASPLGKVRTLSGFEGTAPSATIRPSASTGPLASACLVRL